MNLRYILAVAKCVVRNSNNGQAIQRFRNGYRAAFAVVTDDDTGAVIQTDVFIHRPDRLIFPACVCQRLFGGGAGIHIQSEIRRQVCTKGVFADFRDHTDFFAVLQPLCHIFQAEFFSKFHVPQGMAKFKTDRQQVLADFFSAGKDLRNEICG